MDRLELQIHYETYHNELIPNSIKISRLRNEQLLFILLCYIVNIMFFSCTLSLHQSCYCGLLMCYSSPDILFRDLVTMFHCSSPQILFHNLVLMFHCSPAPDVSFQDLVKHHVLQLPSVSAKQVLSQVTLEQEEKAKRPLFPTPDVDQMLPFKPRAVVGEFRNKSD